MITYFFFPLIISIFLTILFSSYYYFRVHRLTSVCGTIGAEDVIQYVIPHLGRLISIPNDEILASVARQLANIYILVTKSNEGKNGDGKHDENILTVILEHLKTLCAEEEIIVREQAVGSLQRIISKLTPEQILGNVMKIYTHLVSNEWFVCRYSAAYLAPVIISALNSGKPLTKDETVSCENETLATAIQQAIHAIRNSFVHNCADDTPMVRRASALNLSQYAQCFGPEALLSDPYQLLRNFSVDDREAIRAIAASQAVAIAAFCKRSSIANTILPILEGLGDDCAWAPRRAVAVGIPTLCKVLTPIEVVLYVVPLTLRAAFDGIQEVRLAACQALWPLVEVLKPFLSNRNIAPSSPDHVLLTNITTLFERLANDSSPAVKIELANSLRFLPPIFTRDYVNKYFVPTFTSFAEDANAEVRTAILGSLDSVARSAGAHALGGQLIATLGRLMGDKSWRVRRACIYNYSTIASLVGPRLFDKRMSEFIPYSFKDHNQSPRQAMCEQAASLIRILGAQWAQEKLVPITKELFSPQSNYVARVTCMTFIEKTLDEVSPEIVHKHYFPHVILGIQDAVPNVVVVALRCAMSMCVFIDTPSLHRLYETVCLCVDNEDLDVRYFTYKCVETCIEEFKKRRETYTDPFAPAQ